MAWSSYNARMSTRACKFLFNQKIFNATNNKACLMSSSKLRSQTLYSKDGLHAEVSEEAIRRFFTSEDKQYCRNFMDNQKFLPVHWESLEQSLGELKSENIRSTILRSCQVLKKGSLAVDYCQYLINKGEKLSFVETCLLLKILACENDFAKYDKFIKTILNSSSEVLGLEVIVKVAMDVFCQSSTCVKELFRLYKEGKIHSFGIDKLIAAGFDIDHPELAWEIAIENPEKFTSLVIESYLKFCVRMAEQKKFSVDMINNVIDFSKTYTVIIKFDRFYEYIDQLTRVLNESETSDYLWSVSKCDIGSKNLCSSCQYKLKPETVKAKELEEIKKDFLEKVMISYNINMKTTPKELEDFFIFLKKCKPYDIVIDSLNLFGGSRNKKFSGRELLSRFEKQGMRILLIAKDHFKKFEFYNEFKEKWQIFLTRNDSLDDLFCLYAAMNQGLNTYFCTSDFLRDHAKFFDNFALSALFHKWQISHQYLIKHNLKIVYPRSHSDLPQSSTVLGQNNKVKEYSWHLSYLKIGQHYRIETPAEWICLRAKAKNL